jgi:PAS domain S-box-containing protein
MRLSGHDRPCRVDTMGTHAEHLGHPLDGSCQETQGPAAGILARTGELERELTECRRAMQELRVKEERYRTIFEHAVLGIYRTTPDGRILEANPALVRMLGYDRFAELAGRNLEETGCEPGCLRAVFKGRIEAEGQVVGLESAWTRRDGTTLHVRENARVVRDEQGKVKYYEGTVEDITERKRAAEAL